MACSCSHISAWWDQQVNHGSSTVLNALLHCWRCNPVRPLVCAWLLYFVYICLTIIVYNLHRPTAMRYCSPMAHPLSAWTVAPRLKTSITVASTSVTTVCCVCVCMGYVPRGMRIYMRSLYTTGTALIYDAQRGEVYCNACDDYVYHQGLDEAMTVCMGVLSGA